MSECKKNFSEEYNSHSSTSSEDANATEEFNALKDETEFKKIFSKEYSSKSSTSAKSDSATEDESKIYGISKPKRIVIRAKIIHD